MPQMQRLLILVVLAASALAVVAPAGEAAPPRGFFGVMWDRAATRSPAADQNAQWALMAASGVGSVRTVFSWADSQPSAGAAPSFEDTDRLVELAARNGIDLLPVVLGTPSWAARNPGEPGSPPEHASDYAAFLKALVLRYGPAGSFWDERPDLPPRPLRAWQVWNEPHLDLYWSTTGAWAPDYARLLKASKPAIESIDPGATVVLAGLADFAWRHLDRLNRSRIRRSFDVAALNLFTARPKLVMKGVRLFRRALRRGHARRKPIWLTETTWPAAKGVVPVPRPRWQRAWYTTDAGMADRLAGLYKLAARNRRKLRLGRVYWYTWASSYSDGDLFDYSGLVRYQGGAFEPRPALEAYAASATR